MTDLTSLDLETTTLARGANQLGLTALVECGRQIHDGDPAWFLGLLRDFDKLAAEILRLRALIAPGEGCETTEEERKAVPTWRAINGDSPFMARLLRDLTRAEALANEATAALAAAEEREAEWAKGRRPFQNQNAVIAAQVKRIDDLNAALAAEKERADTNFVALAAEQAARVAAENALRGETFATCGQWADETFGPATALRRIERAEEEIEEAKTAPPEKLLEEIADAVICLAAAAHSAGGDLQSALNAKMAINRKRQWSLRGDGTGYHAPAALKGATP